MSDTGLPIEIKLEVYNADNNELLSRVMVAANGLPSLFYPRQIVTIFNTTWQVDRAVPSSSYEFIDSGELKLYVKRPEAEMDVSPILHPMPTSADSVPPLAFGTTKAGKNVLEMDENDWRQFEFVSYLQRNTIEKCLGEIKKVYALETARRGFSRVHVRSEMPEPLYGINIRVSEVMNIFGEAAIPYSGLAFSRFAGLITGGFGLETSTNITLYGVQEEGIVRDLCMGTTEPTGRFRAHVEALASFAIFHNLCLVDWINTTLVPPDLAEFKKYFG